ncbi:hypothetical protein BASA81_001020 [Batrachochytrium salamandrivorans]|nr:hypothetical protein BASA81_001020 [Batrachochytrium salamandrivorans]
MRFWLLCLVGGVTADLAELFKTHFEATLQRQGSSQALADNVAAMGPGRIECISASGEGPFVEFEFGIQSHEAVSIRSISKLLTSLAVLKLVEMNKLKTQDQVEMCSSGVLSATVQDLLSMNAVGMDGRANALRVQQKHKTDPHDALGFPPVCDLEPGMKPAECVDKHLCPLYASPEHLESVEDITCQFTGSVEERVKCLTYPKTSCRTHAHWMQSHCAFACNEACVGNTTDQKLLLQPNERWEYLFVNGSVVRRRTKSCVYDNYAYTLVDALVFKRTGQYLEHWVKELVLKPVGMIGALACLEHDVCHVDCLSPPTTAEEWYRGKFATWRGGSMTTNWVGNAFFASAKDFRALFSVLLNNGTRPDTDERLFTVQTIDLLFNSRAYRGDRSSGQCMGAQEFGYGLGYCEGKETVNGWAQFMFQGNRSQLHHDQPGMSMCTSHHVHFWASSHGSRFSIARDLNVACFAVLNQPIQFASRSHYLAHNMSALLREAF